MAPPDAPFPTKGDIVPLKCSYVAAKEKGIGSERRKKKEREREGEIV